MKAKRDQKHKNSAKRRRIFLFIGVDFVISLLVIGFVFINLKTREPDYQLAYADGCDVIVISVPDMSKRTLSSKNNSCEGKQYDWPEKELTFYRLQDQLIPVSWDDATRLELLEKLPEQTISAAFSPSGSALAYWVPEDIPTHLGILRYGANHRLYNYDYGRYTVSYPITSWSPDESTLAFSSYLSYVSPQLATVDVVSGTFSLLTNTDYPNSNPVFSPDGKKIAFTSHESGYARLAVYDLTTSQPRFFEHGELGYLPTWSADGEKIAFMSNQDGFMNLYMMNVDGSGLQRLTDYQTSQKTIIAIWLE
ncbi:PD40 domain-containing protein [Phototrophicus methaneseepsis]|uniref:PD40 domain-containing protein n=1 Tax=Phototrophicus methaneseepsis TaxID=2710758 RepID=A0A7S8EBG0_9CHLR|nr:DPP IV N-terminal domain-containing protein [Phototrophicus methaneseepsis]QPC83885.1 PD40 domain-containing protein [Phototrophicus methaneseepsis]